MALRGDTAHKKTVRWSFRLDPERLRVWKLAARAQGMRLPEYVRTAGDLRAMPVDEMETQTLEKRAEALEKQARDARAFYNTQQIVKPSTSQPERDYTTLEEVMASSGGFVPKQSTWRPLRTTKRDEDEPPFVETAGGLILD